MKKIIIYIIAVLFVINATAFAMPPIEVADGKYLKIFFDSQFGMTYRDTGGGANREDGTYDFNFRRNRLGFIGTYDERWSFYFQTEYMENKVMNPFYVDFSDNGDNFYVLDAQIRYEYSPSFNVYLGKLKHNLTRENLEACFEPLTFDRSLFVYTPYKTSRDLGGAVWGSFYKGKIMYKADVMNGRSSSYANDPIPGTSPRVTGRLQVSLLDPEEDYGVKGTYLGKKQVLTIGGAYQFESNVVYGDTVARTDKKDYQAYSFDIFFEQPTEVGVFTVSAAYLDIDMDDAYKGVNAPSSSYGLNGQKNGGYVKAGYMLPMDVGPGKLQFFGRYDSFKFANFNNTRTSTDFFEQEITRIGGGFNYYIYGQDLKVSMEYANVNFDKEDRSDGNYQNFNNLDLYLQVRF